MWSDPDFPDFRTVLVTGGLGYIGSHACVALGNAGYRLAIVDNLSNSKPAVLERIRELAPGAQIAFHRADLRDRAALEAAFAAQPVAAVIHFAGLKAVGESVAKPLLYYDNNVGGSVALLEVMARHGVKRLVFSSSATVYGEPEHLPYTEAHPLRPANPYGKNKLVIEHILADAAAADPRFAYAALRYFNPIGAHPSGRIGEDPRGVPNNLFPYLTQVAVGRLPKLRVFGADYPTPDGTGVRDYIHVVDLAAGHLAALEYLARNGRSDHRQPRHRARLLGARDRARVREGHRQEGAGRDRRAPRGRHRELLRRPLARGARARLARAARAGGHVPRRLALAGFESGRVSGLESPEGGDAR